ncbi:MAG: hypothetical protein H7235_08235, partial [Bdellovibrionaceae bacterium]|nr:hypothetical protein [Pseudobdellovibrionaceae bacterium]
MKTLILTFMVLTVFMTPQTWAEGSSGGSSSNSGSSRPWLLSQGAAAREAKRFTLQGWLENKDRSALMDMWLTINTPSPYEFIMGGSMNSYSLQSTSGSTTSTTQNFKKYEGEVSAYAKLVGVTAQYTNNQEEGYNDVTGLFNLRVFGNSVQSSHITFHYGLRTRTAENKTYRLNQQFPAVTLQIYLMKYFGIQGHYRSYLPMSEAFYGDTLGDELNAGVFIDFGSFRIFSDWVQERQNSKLNNIETNFNRNGIKTGLK